MKTLGLILTGQLRTFFDAEVQASFLEFLTGLRNTYKVYGALVINEPSIQPEQFEFLNEYMEKYTIVDYKTLHKEFEQKEEMYRNLLSIEADLGVAEERAKESDGYSHITSFYYQVSQIQEGIKTLKSLGIPFDCFMRTRFDIVYKIEMVPFSNTGSTFFPHSIEQEYMRFGIYSNFNIFSVEDYILWAKMFPWKTMLRINDYVSLLGFGGTYYNNLDIINKKSYIWMYNDHIIIGTPDTFETFLDIWSLFIDTQRLSTVIKNSHIHFVFAPESLFLLHFLNHGITPLMYFDNTWDIKHIAM